MIALEHMQTNALLIVLFGAALALLALRTAVHSCQRVRISRDRAIIHSSRTAPSGTETSGALPEARAEGDAASDSSR